MNQNLLSRVLEFLRRKMWNKRWQRAVTCLAAVAVFGVTYVLIKPAITMTKGYPTLEAEVTEAWSGEELTFRVNAVNPENEKEKTVVLTAEGEGADLSASYAFNEEGICVITDDAGKEIELHRSIREGKKNEVDYWFILDANEDTSFTLELIDKVDPHRFARTVKAVRESREENSAAVNSSEEEKASGSNASKRAVVVKPSASGQTASDSNASKASNSNASKTSDSNADIAEANALAASPEEKILTETDDDGFVQIVDGAVVNDLSDTDDDEDVEPTEIVAELKISAGIGEDYLAAVKDAEMSAEKRNNYESLSQIKFRWEDAAITELVAEEDDANIAVFYNHKAEIPQGAELVVYEIREDDPDYAGYLAQAKSAMADSRTADSSRSVTKARFFDITILDENGEEVEPKSPVKVVITFDEDLTTSEDGDLNVVHFEEEKAPKVFTPSMVEGGENVGALSFTTQSFSVYGLLNTSILTGGVITADGGTVTVTIEYGPEAMIPENSSVSIRELSEDSDAYQMYASQAEELLADEDSGKKVCSTRLFDITILDENGEKVEPKTEVSVKIDYKEAQSISGKNNVNAVHFGEDNTEVLDVDVEGSDKEMDAVSFMADSFSMYAIVGTETITTQYITGDGDTYTIKVTYGPEANIPAGSRLEVSEIVEGSDRYEELYGQAEEAALQNVNDFVSGMRIFDITIKNGEDIIEPDASVEVSIHYDDPMNLSDNTEVKAVHFTADGDIEVISTDCNSAGTEVTYEQGSFSAVAIVEIDHDYTISEAGANPYTSFTSGTQGSILKGSFDDANDWQIVEGEYAGNSSAYKTITSADGKVRVQKNVIPTDTENEFQVYLGIDALTEQIQTTESITEMIDITSNLYYAGHGNPYPPVKASTPEEDNTCQDPKPGPFVNTPHCGQLAPGTQGSAIPCTTATGEGFRLNIWYQGKLIANPYLQTAVPNGVLYMKVGNEYIIICNYKNGKDYDTGRPMPTNSAGEKEANCHLTEMSYNALFNHVVNPSSTESTSVIIGDDENPVTITDPMGSNIVFDGLAYTNSDVSGPYPVAETAGTTVTWTLDPKNDALTSEHITEQPITTAVYTYQREDGTTYTTTTPIEGLQPIKEVDTTVIRTTWWSYNIAEIVYKVHLDVTNEGFTSGSAYDVNGPTVLNYIGGSITFPVPQVKGTLYQFELVKVDEAGNKLPGAVFTLTGPSNNPDVASQTKTVTSAATTGLVSFADLPWGTYTLTETTPPSGHSITEGPWTLNIGYTTDLADGHIEQHEDSSDDTEPDTFPGVWIGNNGDGDSWEVKNPKNRITVTKVVEAFGELDSHKDQIDHVVYLALWDQQAESYLIDPATNQPMYKQVTITGGVPDGPVVFEGVPVGTYTVWEHSAAPITDGNTMQTGVEVDKAYGGTENEIGIELKSITTTGAIDLTSSNTGTATVTNTYEYHNGETEFTVNKGWATHAGRVLDPIPEGLQVTFELYRSENNETPVTTSQTIQLPIPLENGTLSWTAVFENLPTVDSETGNTYSYMVKESDYPDGFLPYLSRTGTTPMADGEYQNTNGGTIWNKQQTTDIVVKKVVEGPDADKNVDFSFTASLPSGTTFPAQGSVTPTDNTYTFSLKDGKTVTLYDIPIRTDMTISEAVDSTVYVTTADGRTDGIGAYDGDSYVYSFNVIDETGVVEFTNTRKVGTLRVRKNVTFTGDTPFRLADREFEFTVTGPSYPEGEAVNINVRSGASTGWTGYADLTNVYVGEYSVVEITENGKVAFDGYTWTMTPEDNNALATVSAESTAANPAEAVITNIYEQITQDIVFYKKWVDHNNKVGYRYSTEQLARVLNLDNGVDGASIPQGTVPAITEDDNDSNTWIITYTALPTYVIGQEAVYSLTENSVARYTTAYENKESEDVQKALPEGTIINTLNMYDLTLLKVDAKTNEPLDVAKFKLLRSPEEEGTPEVYTIDYTDGVYTTSGGTIEFKLPDGYYTLTETQTPDGYIISDSDYTFSIVDGVIEGDQVSSSSETVDGVTTTVYTITIPNTPGKELPETGGPGTVPYTLSGLLLLMTSALLYGFRMRRGERRSM